ncbi:MAG: GAF domain-containing protein [Verrucomicrobiales bacterium]|nr:GAF domain-containing protein [Verrucomicrobiales bacterium]
MADFETALNRIADRSISIVKEARDLLRDVISDACKTLSAAEGSILIPTPERTHLQFLVSINPELDRSDFTFPTSESVSGFVFNSGQAIAKINPESEIRDEADQISKVETQLLMAVPITDSNRILGVATFVNRTGKKKDKPFSPADLETAQSLGEIFSAGLKFFQQVALSADLTRVDLSELASELGTSSPADVATDGETDDFRDTARLVEISQALQDSERSLLNDMAGLLLEHSRRNQDEF